MTVGGVVPLMYPSATCEAGMNDGDDDGVLSEHCMCALWMFDDHL